MNTQELFETLTIRGGMKSPYIRDGDVVIPVLGGEIVMYNGEPEGSGKWYFNDTAD